MNNPLNQTKKTKKILHIIIILSLFCTIACTSNKAINTDIPTIHLSPEEAGTLQVSDFFESYKLFEFKGTLFSGIDDFMELGDKRIAILNFYSGDRKASPSKLAIFDTLGNFLYQIGTIGRGPGEYLSLPSHIHLKQDSSFDIIDLNGNKYLNYSFNNKVNKEQISLYNMQEGFPQMWLNDTLLLSNQYDNESSFYIYLTLPYKQKVHKKYLPTDQSKKDYIMEISGPYKINDTICIYSDQYAHIYNIGADTITPRYYFDKGKYTEFIKRQDLIKGKNDINDISDIRSFENNKYLLGRYTYKSKIYYYIYDKKKNITYNYKNVNENIAFMSNTKAEVWPSQVIILNNLSLQISDKYLYMPILQSKFRSLVEDIKKNLIPQEWENYRQTHQDIIAAYENYDEETSNTVIIGFKYK